MRPEDRSGGQKRASFIEEARRAQILECAIETFAELGYANTSLARIAERAGISKGVISYHFAGKSELMEQLVEQVYREITQFVLPRMEKESTATGALRANIRSVAEYMRGHRAQRLALGEIFNNLRTPDGKRRYGIAFNEPIYVQREAMFRLGQQTGELRPFDPRVMAVTVQAAIDEMFAYWATYPDHDLEAHADELADLFEHATRAERPGGAADR
ncbi:TetR family transcriptional regulator [Pseudonocardia hierapolitana]|uniref:TetR family transcriptional regulator n=1 Tax=Pseudonocardia hierapolitana TaxID=1128676 RepID=A0A561SKA4_9PSEU|nr:TetR family transcriptional regulator [Pseudonocardia hierapolitana]TWF75300.1 TetR family transcriptional regulator [Pseudonocardia hierapolitana]